MRIRSILPAFWESEDIAAMDWETRLVFIGLWSYVDDNGVGRDIERLIVADLFALEEDPRETLATVSRALQTLSTGGQITRYKAGSRRYLHVVKWDTYQRIDRPGKVRYPLPTCDDVKIRETLATVSRDTRDTLAPGEGEKGRRGEGKEPSSADADAAFEAFWALCPRKVGKDAAKKAWTKAAAKVAPLIISQGLRKHLPLWKVTEERFIPHPATWLNEGRWQDEVKMPVAVGYVRPSGMPEGW